MRWPLLILAFSLLSCVGHPNGRGPSNSNTDSGLSDTKALNPNSFAKVAKDVLPIAISECRRRTQGQNCDFQVVIEKTRRPGPGATQTINKDGQPVLTFSTLLLKSLRNTDELAFVFGHEAAHHIAGHLALQKERASKGAEKFANLATLQGGNAAAIAEARKLGTALGVLIYSQEYELAADSLGTIITHRAGYNPLLGAMFFNTLPDARIQFLSTHPPNAARLKAVRRAAARLGITE